MQFVNPDKYDVVNANELCHRVIGYIQKAGLIKGCRQIIHIFHVRSILPLSYSGQFQQTNC